jgi:hypothetical protein
LNDWLGRTLGALKDRRWLRHSRLARAKACPAAPTSARPTTTASRGGLDELDIDARLSAHNGSQLQRSVFMGWFFRPGIESLRARVLLAGHTELRLYWLRPWISVKARRRAAVGPKRYGSWKFQRTHATLVLVRPNVRVQPRAAALGLGRVVQDKPQYHAAQDQCRCASAATRG